MFLNILGHFEAADDRLLINFRASCVLAAGAHHYYPFKNCGAVEKFSKKPS